MTKTAIVVLSLTTFSRALYAQAQPSGQPDDGGFWSMMPSPYVFTAILLLVLAILVIYRRRRLPAKAKSERKPAARPKQTATEKKKRRYSSSTEMSKLLKESATAKNAMKTAPTPERQSEPDELPPTPAVNAPPNTEPIPD